MSIYTELAQGLLKIAPENEEEFIWMEDNGLRFGLKHKKDYSGLMAKIKPEYLKSARKKQGYFDFLGITGVWGKIKHDALLEKLLDNVTIEECKCIWRGKIPQNLTESKKNILITLAILMFEQEVNFGNEIWQRPSHFSPDIENPRFRRPRDLLMGYIDMVFCLGKLSSINRFKNERGHLLPPPKNSDLERRFFTSLQNDEEAEALMTGSILESFERCVANQPINKDKKKYYAGLSR
ncbi:hypothetical protein [Priestia filamentosa]|uniref:hypothetical protein n=1 Tax=Priestia filamentosa TaxID=1402861 RepID=UPI003981A15B